MAKKNVHKVGPLTEGKKKIIASLLEECTKGAFSKKYFKYIKIDILSNDDIDMLKNI
ncbi:MAG: hypothetical protein ACRDA4_01520 [Filifactoraceae bacterium]